MRADGRQPDELRPVQLTSDFMPYAEGSVLIETGQTRVICAVSVEESVPPFRKGQGIGWLTAEYRMLPRATQTRTARESARGHPDGRTYEIQRLIGRALRSILDFARLGERMLIVDCDVLQADGGTRTAAITGSCVAVALATRRLRERGVIEQDPLIRQIAAVSVGIVNGVPMLDLNYEEDSHAEVDLNLVMTAGGDYVEVQGTAEREPFSRDQLDALLALGRRGIHRLVAAQRQVLG